MFSPDQQKPINPHGRNMVPDWFNDLGRLGFNAGRGVFRFWFA